MEKKIHEEIIKTGYPIELKVGNMLTKRKWNVSYNKYYLDQDEQKGREIDIVGFRNNRCKNKTEIGFFSVAEIKKSLKYKWVIFSGRIMFNDFLAGTARMHFGINCKMSDFLTIEEIEKDSGLSNYKRAGRSYWEAFKEGEKGSKDIFNALTKTIKASEYLLGINKKSGKNLRKDDEKLIYLFEPIIIFDGDLYEAFLDEKDDIKLEKVNRILVSFDYKSPAYNRYSYGVQIITLPELQNYILEKEKWLDSLGEIINSKSKE